MQQKNEKTSFLAKTIGNTIKQKRIYDKKYSINKLAREYDLDIGNLSRIEKGIIDIKFVTLWKIAESLSIKPSELVQLIEQNVGKEFHLYED